MDLDSFVKAKPTERKPTSAEDGGSESHCETPTERQIRDVALPLAPGTRGSAERLDTTSRNITSVPAMSTLGSQERNVRFNCDSTSTTSLSIAIPDSKSRNKDPAKGVDESRTGESEAAVEKGGSEPSSPRLGSTGWVSSSQPRAAAHLPTNHTGSDIRAESDVKYFVSTRPPKAASSPSHGKENASLLDVSVSETTGSRSTDDSMHNVDVDMIEARCKEDMMNAMSVASTRSEMSPDGVGPIGPRGTADVLNGATLDASTVQQKGSAGNRGSEIDDFPRLFYPVSGKCEKSENGSSDGSGQGALKNAPPSLYHQFVVPPHASEGGVDPQHVEIDDGMHFSDIPKAQRQAVTQHGKASNYERLIDSSIQLYPPLPPPIADEEVINIKIGIDGKVGSCTPLTSIPEVPKLCLAPSGAVIPTEVAEVACIEKKSLIASVRKEAEFAGGLNANVDSGSLVRSRLSGASHGCGTTLNDATSAPLLPAQGAMHDAVPSKEKSNAVKPVDVHVISRAPEMWREVLSKDMDLLKPSSNLAQFLSEDLLEGLNVRMDSSNADLEKLNHPEVETGLPIRCKEIVRSKSDRRKSKSVERQIKARGQPETRDVGTSISPERQLACVIAPCTSAKELESRCKSPTEELVYNTASPYNGKMGVDDPSAEDLEGLCHNGIRLIKEKSDAEDRNEEEEREREIHRAKRFERLNLALLKLQVCRKNKSPVHDTDGECSSPYETGYRTCRYSSGRGASTTFAVHTPSAVAPQSNYWDPHEIKQPRGRYGTRRRALFPPPCSPTRSSREGSFEGLIHTPGRAPSYRDASWMFDRSPDGEKYSSYYCSNEDFRVPELRVHDRMAAKTFAREISSLASAVKGSEMFSLI
uniref:Uncharacterized protein n=1 Tax=Trypanosoma congolense (strain IL3000) TaxID=1068625 RepID=G0ULE6_TRYCI|nr:conserved hypothetical protein [Trypanosoma congolense IL3000]